MHTRDLNKWFILGVMLLLFGVTVGAAVNTIERGDTHDIGNSAAFTDITVGEAWDLLNDTANGIQIPIDVRTPSEWVVEHIDVPAPERPRHHCLDDLENEVTLQEFMALYEGETIILYCKSGGRSTTAATILVNHGFIGTIYNMLGGITAWKAAGYPVKPNEPPTLEILNPKRGYFHISGLPLVPTLLNLLADTMTLGGFRLKPIQIRAVDDYDASSELTVELYIYDDDKGNGVWCSEIECFEWLWTGPALGTFTLKMKARDAYGAESDWTMLDVWNFCLIS